MWIHLGMLVMTVLSGLLLPTDVAFAEAGKPNSLTMKEIADGWTLLFDGETTKGWTAEEVVNRAYWDFAAKNGVMILETINGGYAIIEHDRKLRYFHLKGEYRVSGLGETPWAGLLLNTEPRVGIKSSIHFPATDEWQTFTVQLAPDARVLSVAGKVVYKWKAPTGHDKDKFTPVELETSRISFFVPMPSTIRLKLRNLKLRSLDPAP